MLTRARAQEGSALVTALLVMILFLVVGLSTAALVDGQQRESGRERVRESSFQLTEGVLNTQIYLLSRQWPGEAATQWTLCTPANQADARCPDHSRLASTFEAVDYEAGFGWTSRVHDNQATANGPPDNFYDDAVVTQRPQYDQGQDGLLWVRAQGVVRGRERTIVALVRAEELTSNFPRVAVVAGALAIHPSGNHTYVDTNGQPDGEAGRVIVRCGDVASQSCVKWDASKGQIGPQVPESVPQYPSALSPETIEQLRDRARALGSYYPKPGATCPPSLTGTIVFIENAAPCGTYDLAATQSYNTPQQPGMLVIGSGYFELKAPYHGLIYHVNGSDGVGTPIASPNTALRIHANGFVKGAVVIDGNAKLEIGSNSGGPNNNGNLVYDPNARNALKTFGTAGIVQNSFRELAPAAVAVSQAAP